MNAALSSALPGFLERRSPLGTVRGAPCATVFAGAWLRIDEEAFLPIVSLRLSRRIDPSALPLEFAQAPNTFTGTAAGSVARYEPRAWMLLGAEVPTATPDSIQATDLSARLASFRLSGEGAQTVLSASTATIPNADGFLRTFFAESYAVLLQRLGPEDFRLLVDVSFASAIAAWLADAAALSH